MLISFKKPHFSVENILIFLLFTFSLVAVVAEWRENHVFTVVFKPFVAVLLIVLYWLSSKRRDPIFFACCFFLLCTSIMMMNTSMLFVILGVISIVIFRILLIVLILRLQNLKKIGITLLAIVPFLCIFSYLLFNSEGLPLNSHTVIMIQNVIVAVALGIIVSLYINQTLSNNTVWLYIFGLLYASLYFLLLIEKCFLAKFPLSHFEPLIMMLHVSCYYAFYKYVRDVENKSEIGTLL